MLDYRNKGEAKITSHKGMLIDYTTSPFLQYMRRSGGRIGTPVCVRVTQGSVGLLLALESDVACSWRSVRAVRFLLTCPEGTLTT